MTHSTNKNVIIFNGSPRPQGNTAVLVKWFKEALQQHDWQVAQVDLFNLNFKGCYHCDHCKSVKNEHGCIVKDDLLPILDQTVLADTFVIASPVYCWSVSGSMSAMLDRWYSMFKAEKSLIKGKKIIGAFTSGSDAFDGMDLCVAMLKNLCAYGGATYVGTLAAPNCTTPEELAAREYLKKSIIKLINKRNQI